MEEKELKKAISHLKKDKVMAKLIKKHGNVPFVRKKRINLFEHLIASIISQQLSTKAADTIYSRFVALFRTKSFPEPKEVLSMPDEKIRGAGISYSKISYIKGVARAVLEGEIDLRKIVSLSDEEFVREITKLKGIGQWTAEMILIFSLFRWDVFSMGDLGLKTAVSRLYNIDRSSIKEIEQISLRWSPYRSIAARYLWKSLDNK